MEFLKKSRSFPVSNYIARIGALLVVSCGVVALGQPIWVPMLAGIASAVGFALCWRALLWIPSRVLRCGVATGWFFVVQAVQLSWMTATTYMGPLIWIVYLFLALAMGLQFGLVSLCIRTDRVSVLSLLSIASLWVLCEWVRLFFLSGFTWSYVGLALAGPGSSIAFASLVGLYGLSFWVMWVNGMALKAWMERSAAWGVGWLLCALLPYCVGVYMHSLEKEAPKRVVHTLLMNTRFLPEEKVWTKGREDLFIPLLTQWQQLLRLLSSEHQADLIVFPESTVPYGAFQPLFSYAEMQRIWVAHFGEQALEDLPLLQAPYAQCVMEKGQLKWKVSNAFWAQAIANHYHAVVVAGFDDRDLATGIRYAAAFYFQPHQNQAWRYEKRVLVPIGEYIPCMQWGWLRRFLAEHLGVSDSFHPGTKAKVFPTPHALGISICCEETYSDLLREMRLQGAELFVNLTNDVWFPESRLPAQHCEISRVRAVENGVVTVRACNHGETIVMDERGTTLAHGTKDAGVLAVDVPIRCTNTFYTLWGDRAVCAWSAFFVMISSITIARKRQLR